MVMKDRSKIVQLLMVIRQLQLLLDNFLKQNSAFNSPIFSTTKVITAFEEPAAKIRRVDYLTMLKKTEI